jgi:cob(I)alamin adenosyltransferase
LKIYTKTGDKGQTSLWGGDRVSKSHLRIESYGTVDELNSNLGLVGDYTSGQLKVDIKHLQDILFVVGAMLATPTDKKFALIPIDLEDILWLEKGIDTMESQLEPLKNFILPGGHPAVSHCHVARCVCRRAERLVVALNDLDEAPSLVIEYLNRLSDYLFVLSRFLAKENHVEEIIWVAKK